MDIRLLGEVLRFDQLLLPVLCPQLAERYGYHPDPESPPIGSFYANATHAIELSRHADHYSATAHERDILGDANEPARPRAEGRTLSCGAVSEGGSN
jgi:hypothetical protein